MSDSAQINLQRQLDKRNNNKLDQNITKHEADNLSQNQNNRTNCSTWKTQHLIINIDANMQIEGEWNMGAWIRNTSEETLATTRLSQKGYHNPIAECFEVGHNGEGKRC